MLNNKNIVVCVTGGIAVYKVVDMVSRLKKAGAQVQVAMTKGAQEFVSPITFQAISNNRVYTKLFDETDNHEIPHIILAQKPDLIVIAPATANIIGKVSHGIADDLVSTIIMAAKVPVLFVPAMNTAMYENPIVQGNINFLKGHGYTFLDPEVGTMAMKAEGVGVGRLPEPPVIVEAIEELYFSE